jgi:LysM repeat protein
MSTPNPLVPQGSLLEQQARSRSTFQMAAFIVALHVVVLGGFLFLGCKKEEGQTQTPAVDTFATPPPVQTEVPPSYDPYAPVTNSGIAAIPPVSNYGTPETTTPPTPAPYITAPTPSPVTAPFVSGGGTEYTIKKGDVAFALAKKNGVSLKRLQEVNPGKDLAKLKVGDKIQIPAGGAPAAGSRSSATPAPVAKADGTTYRVKGGDNLSKLAKKFGTTVKAIREANGMTSNEIKVGQSLVIPGKSSAAIPSAERVPEPSSAPISAPLTPPVVTPLNPVGGPGTPQ